MSSDVVAFAGIATLALAAEHIQFFCSSALETRGLYKQDIRTTRGHAAHWGCYVGVGPPPA